MRNSKVGGQGFVDRDDDHVKGAKEARPLSKFYRLYPSRNQQEPIVREGGILSHRYR